MANAQKGHYPASLTHGQPATPSTLGKEIMVFVERLERMRDDLATFKMQGKFGGAVGTYGTQSGLSGRKLGSVRSQVHQVSVSFHSLVLRRSIRR